MEDVSEETELVHRLVYSSVGTIKFSPEELLELLETARSNNERMHLSGMLLFHEGTFLQVLEGDEEAVESLYSMIEEDPRHDATRILLREDQVERSFGDWTMGFARATPEMMDSIDGLNDFLRSTGDTAVGARSEDTDDRARKILDQFKMGRWHRKLE